MAGAALMDVLTGAGTAGPGHRYISNGPSGGDLPSSQPATAHDPRQNRMCTTAPTTSAAEIRRLLR